MNQKTSYQNVFWFVIFAFAAVLHVVGLQQPFLGNFAQHQTDYATVVQRWLVTPIDPLAPVMRFLHGGEYRLFMGDIPWTMTLVALVCKTTGASIELVSRGLSALCFFISIIPFYGLARFALKDRSLILGALFFYVYAPLTIIYGQSFLLEIPGLMLGLWAYYFFFKSREESSRKLLILSALFFSLMLGTRIYYAPIIIPAGLLLIHDQGWKTFKDPSFWLFCFLVLLIPIAWQGYAMLYAQSQGQPSSIEHNARSYIFNDEILKRNLRNPRFFLPLFDIILLKIATPVGFVLALIGLFSKQEEFKKTRRFLRLALLSFIPLVLIAVRKFVAFEYYYLPLLPVFCLLAAIPLKNFMVGEQVKRVGILAIGIVTILYSLRYSMAPVLIVPDEDRSVLVAAEKVRELTKPEDKVIASHGSSTSFLYYTDRDGWFFSLPDRNFGYSYGKGAEGGGTAIERLERLRGHGARYFALANRSFVSLNPKFMDYLETRYKKVFESPDSIIYSLTDLK